VLSPSVRGNAWDTIPVPGIGDWVPTMKVSVIMPYYQAPQQIDITLAALSQQSYPAELLEVVVGDDGSEPPLGSLPRPGSMAVRVIRQQRDGFGLARARNLGAKNADGDILVFLDCDMVPERNHIEAHARWHHQIDYSAVFGLRKHVSFDGIEPSNVSAAVGADRLSDLFSGRAVTDVAWVRRHLDRTNWLKLDTPDPWRVTSGGNLSLRRDLFWEVGGYDESFRQWGNEDNEFGYRLYANGAVIVPEPIALAWHQGEGHEPTEEEIRSLEEQRPKLINLIPDPTIRRMRTGRSYTVPMLTVHVLGHAGTREQTLSVVESVLAGRFSDLVVFVDMPHDDPHLEWMRRQFQHDGRVRVGSDLDPISEIPNAAIRMELPGSILLSVGTLESVIGLIWNDRLDALHITHPDWGNSRELVEVYTTRAWKRAARLDDDPRLRGETIGRLFGERWISGTSYGCVVADPTGDFKTERSWLSELEARDEQIRQLTSRLSLRVANAVGTALRARSWTDLSSALRGLRVSKRDRAPE